MEKCNREDVDFFLPKDIIQHIQSFLSAKEAAQTSVFSKSWYTAWLTRSNLVFDQRDFGWNDDRFWKFVKKTMQRYNELKLRIQSLSVRLSPRQCTAAWKSPDYDYSYSLADKLIVRAMKLGVTDFNFELDWPSPAFDLPREVLGSKTLMRLSVTGCKIELGVDGKVSCSRLESLSLHRVYTDCDIIWDIISSCPLIEKLSLSECTYAAVSLRPFHKLSGSVLNGKGFSKLKCLFLERVHIDTSFFHDFSSKFPCLKDLSVHDCDGYSRVRIDSSSLECVTFVHDKMLMAEFDVPCIRKFMYKGRWLPSLSFKEYSRGWKSDISLTIDSHFSSEWCLRLKELLAKLSRYEISLSLTILDFRGCYSYRIVNFWDNPRHVQGPPAVEVEDLMLCVEVPSSKSTLILDGLFWICRPKFVTLHFFPILGKKSVIFYTAFA